MNRILIGLLSASAVACGGAQPGRAGDAVRPDAPKAAGVVDGPSPPCRAVGESGHPLIVDWPAHERQNMEEAMMNGVAIVSYDCNQLRLLNDCRADGTYGFLGLSKREEVVQLVDADEIRANLPTLGGALVSDIGTEVGRGASLDLAMVLAGKTKTTVPSVARGTLSGRCDGATHFVRGAYVGAFAMTKGTKGTVRSSAQIFGAGAAASSGSSRLAASRDGDPIACSLVNPGDAQAPLDCRAAIRLELLALSEGATAPSASAIDEMRRERACPEGLVRVGEKCTAPASDTPYQCSGDDASECATQCERGDLGSCFVSGVLHENGTGVARDYGRAAALYRRTCDAGLARGCNRLGVMHFYGGNGVVQDGVVASRLFLASCRAGLADACSNLGVVLDVGRGVPRDSKQAARLFVAACNGGDVPGCFNAGVLHADGRGVSKDPSKAATLFSRAREGGLIDRFRFGCEHGNAYSCFGLGYMLREGLFLVKDARRARQYFEMSCPAIEWSCEALGRSPRG